MATVLAIPTLLFALRREKQPIGMILIPGEPLKNIGDAVNFYILFFVLRKWKGWFFPAQSNYCIPDEYIQEAENRLKNHCHSQVIHSGFSIRRICFQEYKRRNSEEKQQNYSQFALCVIDPYFSTIFVNNVVDNQHILLFLMMIYPCLPNDQTMER